MATKGLGSEGDRREVLARRRGRGLLACWPEFLRDGRTLHTSEDQYVL